MNVIQTLFTDMRGPLMILYILQSSCITVRQRRMPARVKNKTVERGGQSLFSYRAIQRQHIYLILHHPVQCTEAHHTSKPGERQTMVLCPTGGFGVSICPHCSPAWGNLRPLDQTRAKMNSNVEHLKKPFCVFFFCCESYGVCLKARVRPSQCPT